MESADAGMHRCLEGFELKYRAIEMVSIPDSKKCRTGLSRFGDILPIEHPRVLFWLPHGIGDAIMMTPAITGLRTAYPDARIEAVFFRSVSCQVVDGHPVLDCIHHILPRWSSIAIRLLRLRGMYDLAVIPPGLNLWKHRWMMTLLDVPSIAGVWPRHLNHPWFTHGVVYSRGWFAPDLNIEALQTALPKTVPGPPLFYMTEGDLEDVELLWDSLRLSGKNVLAVATGSDPSANYKRWKLDRFIDVTKRFLYDHPDWAGWVVLGPGERAQEEAWRSWDNGRVVVTTQLPLKLVAAALRRCRIVLANDSGIAHVAGVSGVPSVVIFGPTDSNFHHPFGNVWTTLGASNCDLQPCYPHFGERFNPARCPYGFKCLEEIKTEHVLEALERRLAAVGSEKLRIRNGNVTCS